ncbi:hypothetical protein BSNK01_28170 [Bacillaceae bacterium]
MEIELLKTFQRVAVLGSITKAADDLYLSVSTVTNRIKVLEEQLGKELFHRAGRKIELTEEGRQFLDYVSRFITILQEGLNKVQGSREVETGELSIATTPVLASYLFPKLLKSFRALYPQIHMKLAACSNYQVVDKVSSGKVEIGIVQEDGEEGNMVIQDWFTDEILLVMKGNHPLAEREYLRPLDLQTSAILVSRTTHWEKIEQWFRHGNVRPDVIMNVNHVEALKKMLEHLDAISFLPRLAVLEELSHGRLKTLPLSPSLSLQWKARFIYRNNWKLSNTAKIFLHYAYQYVGREKMDLLHLEIFSRLVEQKNFSRVAKELGISQPTVTIRIKALEEELGVPLIMRAGNKVSITPAGQVFYEHIKRSLRVWQDGLQMLKGSEGKGNGWFSIAGTPTVNTYFLPPLLGRFHREHPLLKISLHSGYSWEVVQMVLDGVVHLGFVAGTLEHQNLISLPLYKDRYCAICHPSHPLAEKQTVSMYDLHREPLLIYQNDSNTSYLIKSLFRDFCLRMNVGMELNYSDVIKHMILEGNGIAFLPWIVVEQEVKEGKLKALPLQLPRPLYREIHVVFSKKHVKTRFVHDFLRHLQLYLVESVAEDSQEAEKIKRAFMFLCMSEENFG